MGFNTTVVVMNDALDWIAKDPKFGENLAHAILRLSRNEGPVDVPAFSDKGGVHVNAATAIETHHADMHVMVAVGGNFARNFGSVGFWADTDEELLRGLADKMGFRLTKKPQKKG